MIAFLLAREENERIACEISDFLRGLCVATSIFTAKMEFWNAVRLSKPGQLDFLLMDFTAYQMDAFNPYLETQAAGREIPLVLFNDPYPEESGRADYWRLKNKNYMPSAWQDDFFNELYPVWKELEIFLNSDKINPYVPAIRRTKEWGGSEDFNPADFVRRAGLSPTRARLFNILYERKDSDCPAQELCLSMWSKCTKKEMRLLYSYIHDIRSAFSKEENVRLFLDRTSAGRYKFSLEPTSART